MHPFIFILSVLSFISCQNENRRSSTDDGHLFKRLLPEKSGVDFINNITADVSTRDNLLDFDYFYNGAGVGAGDFNNDGLTDLFFTANQVDNRLYLNKGNFVFEDVTERAGVNQGKQWCNGVTLVDINSDGWLDIYVSQGGPRDRSQRKNLLYLNQGDLTFREMALEYGLDDEGISTQSVFFDYDRDGDQDCLVMNENELYGYDPISFYRTLLENPRRYQASFSHLYRNDSGHYTDVSKEAGIVTPTFGLGLVISDFNDDDWPDIYIANDYYQPDNLYINLKNGKFSDQAKNRLGQMSFFGMGVDVADLDNDLHQDIIVLDMASKDHVRSKTLMASMNVEIFSLLVDQLEFPHQYMFNTIQINDGQGRFDNVAHMSGLAKTDWSWAALVEDFDLDGDKDVFVSNGYRQYALDNDFKQRVNEAKRRYNNAVPLEVKQELYATMPSEALANVVFANDGDLSFSSVGKEWGLDEPTFSNGAAVADLDNDGDLDLVINNIDQVAFVYRNTAVDRGNNNFLTVTSAEVHGQDLTEVIVITGDERQVVEPKSVRGYRSHMPAVAHFGLGSHKIVDSLIVVAADGTRKVLTTVAINQRIELEKVDGWLEIGKQVSAKEKLFSPFSTAGLQLDFRHRENTYNDFAKEILLPQKQSTMGPPIEVADINGDGLDDIVAGGAADQATTVYVQIDGSFALMPQPALEQDRTHEDVGLLLFDLDRDGDLDLLAVSGGNAFPEGDIRYSDRLYINDGDGRFLRKANGVLSSKRFSGGCARSVDMDNDGDLDVIIGNRIIPQSYPIAAPPLLLENVEGTLQDVTSQKISLVEDLGIINDIAILDIDGDKDDDMILVGEWMGIRVLLNNGGTFEESEQFSALTDLKGWWFSITPTDFNHDNLPDLLVGNVGLNIKHKASREVPFKVYANDFDETGTLDIVLSSEYQGEYVPVRGRECSSQQMPMITEKFKSYAAFANATLAEIYGEENLAAGFHEEVITFSSVLLINEGQGFSVAALPKPAQKFPLLDAIVIDLDGDGYEDILAAGCIYETEVETPRLDAGHGLVMLNEEGAGYGVADGVSHKIYIPGNVKCLGTFHLNDQTFLIAGKNNDVLSLFKIDI